MEIEEDIEGRGCSDGVGGCIVIVELVENWWMMKIVRDAATASPIVVASTVTKWCRHAVGRSELSNEMQDC